MASQRRLKIGSRGSALALWQARRARRALEALLPGAPGAEIAVISTSGDRSRAPLWKQGGKGLFVKELEEALLAGRIDMAVHSLKDIPSEMPPALALAACLQRADPRDAFISRNGRGFGSLKKGARVGTSSPRREAQLRRMRPDLKMIPLRGNVPTRVEKVRRGEMDAAVLACAGLERLGLTEHIAGRFSPARMIPAAGQGIVALQCRKADRRVFNLLKKLRHPAAWAEMQAERAFLAAMHGDCRSPLAALARLRGGSITMRGMAASLDGRRMLRASVSGSAANPAALGRRLARKLLARGAAALVAESMEAMRT